MASQAADERADLANWHLRTIPTPQNMRTQ